MAKLYGETYEAQKSRATLRTCALGQSSSECKKFCKTNCVKEINDFNASYVFTTYNKTPGKPTQSTNISATVQLPSYFCP